MHSDIDAATLLRIVCEVGMVSCGSYGLALACLDGVSIYEYLTVLQGVRFGLPYRGTSTSTYLKGNVMYGNTANDYIYRTLPTDKVPQHILRNWPEDFLIMEEN